jgi:hypothetical protein
MYHVVVTITRKPTLPADHTSIVTFRALMSDKEAILTISQNYFCHILCLFAAIWQMMGS